jgi:hypothetical protein
MPVKDVRMKLIAIVFAASLVMVQDAGGQHLVKDSSRSAAAASSVGARQPTVEGWRYKWHNGHWWYYQPNKQWLFWNGTTWSAYLPAAYQRFIRRGWYPVDFGQRVVRDGPGFSESGEIYQNRD